MAQTGVPRAILDDHGADLHGGVEIFREAHPETIEVYDINHKAACLLKARLEGDARWKAYATANGAGEVRRAADGVGVPGAPQPAVEGAVHERGGAGGLGGQDAGVGGRPVAVGPLGITAERVRDKLGWLEEFRAALAEWSAYQAVIDGALGLRPAPGLVSGRRVRSGRGLPAASGGAGELREELIEFVRGESLKARLGERLPGTTEVLESCFGKLKALEDGQSKSGFTGLVLSLGAMVSKWTAESIGEALERCRVRDVLDWCRESWASRSNRSEDRHTGRLCGATNPG